MAGACKRCGVEREFAGSWDETANLKRQYGRNYDKLRGAAVAKKAALAGLELRD